MTARTKSIKLIVFMGLIIFYEGIAQDLNRYTYSEPAMGTVINITFFASDTIKANTISKAIFKKVNFLNTIFSDYDSSSELNLLCRDYEINTQVHVSDKLFDILLEAKKVSDLTDGAFDITVGLYTKMWRQAKKENKLPTEQQLEQAKNVVGYQNILLDARTNTVTFKKTRMQIDLGGIAKGYTADEILKVFKSFNIKHALIDFGGDITVSNAPPNKKGWNIEVSYTNYLGEKVSEILSLSNTSIATSGDYYQKLKIDGNTYSHIINPSTGLGLTKTIQVTVIANTGALADSFASAISVMSKKDIKKVLRNNEDLHVLITSFENGVATSWKSEMLNNFLFKE